MSGTDDVGERIAALIVEMAPLPLDGWTRDTMLGDDLGYDSITAVELVFEVEREFDIGRIPDDTAFDVDTVGGLADVLAELVRARNAA